MVIKLSERKNRDATPVSSASIEDRSPVSYDDDLHSYGARAPYRGSVKKDDAITPLTRPYEGVVQSGESSSSSEDEGGEAVTPYVIPSQPNFQIGGMMPRPPRHSIRPGAAGSDTTKVTAAAASDDVDDDGESDVSGVELLMEIHSKLHENHELQKANHQLLKKNFEQPHHTFFEEVFHDSVVILSWLKFFYKLLGAFPVLGPWLQCVFLLNTFCGILIFIPVQVRELVIIPLLSMVGLLLKIFFYPLGVYTQRLLLSPHMNDVGVFFKDMVVDAVSEAFYLVGKGAMTLTGSDYLLTVMREVGISAPVPVEPHSFDFLFQYLPHGVVETAKSLCPGC